MVHETLPGHNVRNLVKVSCVRSEYNVLNLRNQIQVKISLPGSPHIERGPYGRTENDPFTLVHINTAVMSDVFYILPVGYGEVQGEEGVVPMVCQVTSVIKTDTQTEHTD